MLIGLLGVLAVLLGFLTTYITPTIKGTFQAPLIVHIHGALSFCWVILFFVQAMSIKFRSFRFHRTAGFCGLFLALAIVWSMLPVGLFQVRRDLSKGLGDIAISQIIGVATTAIMFGVLVATGYLYRRRPKIHKRLLLLATIILLWPAWFRFRHYFPSIQRPDIWFAVVLADSLIVLSWIVDKMTFGKIHPVLLYGGLFIIAEHIFEVLMFDTAPWRMWAKAIYSLFV